MKTILNAFCQESGQRVNFDKSKTWFSPNTSYATKVAISAQFDIAPTSDLGKYLGVPLASQRLGSVQFRYLVDKVGSKLGGWKCRLSSQAARLVLIQSVTSAIPAYAMNTCKLPRRTIEGLEKLHRDFLWGDWNQHPTVHPVAWKQVCCPKELGGLGIRDLTDMNQSLLAKLV